MVDDNSVRQGALPEQVEGAQAREDKEIAASLRGCGKRPYAPSFPLYNLPQRGELNTSGAEKAERANESARCESKRKEASFIAGCGKIFHEEIGFPAPCWRVAGGSLDRSLRSMPVPVIPARALAKRIATSMLQAD